MERVAVDVEGLHLGIANLDALLVGARVERTLDLQASLGRGRRDQLDDGQSVRQRSATPALRDMAEQAVLDLVPLRSSRGKTPALARLHQLNREHDGDRAPRLSCEAVAKCCNGAALDSRWNDGSS